MTWNASGCMQKTIYKYEQTISYLLVRLITVAVPSLGTVPI
jgi:hypothetical protein